MESINKIMMIRLIMITFLALVMISISKEIDLILFYFGYVLCWIFSMIHIKIYIAEKKEGAK